MRGLHVYVGAVAVAAAAAVVTAAALDPSLDRLWLGAVCAALIAASHRFDVRVRRGRGQRETYSHEESYLVVLLLLASPLVAVLAFVAGFVGGNLLMRRERIKGLFNASAMTLEAAVAAGVYHALGGDGEVGYRDAVAALAAALAFAVLNRLLVAHVLTRAGVGTTMSNLRDDVANRAWVGGADIAVGLLAGLAALHELWTLPFGLAALAALHRALSAHAQARADRQMLADLVASSSDGIVSLDRSGRITSWNPACERITGHRAADVVGRPAALLAELLSVPGAEPFVVTPAEAAREPAARVLESLTATGERRWIGVNVGPTPDGGAVVVIRDETRRIERDEAKALAESERLRADLVASVSHELRTPLTSILGFTETMLVRDVSPEERARYLEIVGEQGMRLLELINQLLDLRQLAEGELPRERVDLRELLEEEVRDFDRASPSHRLTLDADAPLPVVGDRRRLRQVVTNLLSNAVKYSPDGGDVAVTARAGNGRVVFAVRDEGVGIAEDEQEHVFERFFRASRVEESEIRGSGLGLALALEIARAHGGDVSFVSREGEGSTFTVEFPAAPGPAD